MGVVRPLKIVLGRRHVVLGHDPFFGGLVGSLVFGGCIVPFIISPRIKKDPPTKRGE